MRSSFVYDPLHPQLQHQQSRMRRVRADPTTAYVPCKLKPIRAGDTGYKSVDECSKSTVCLGPAYNYQCADTEGAPARLVFSTEGQIDTNNLQCYGCSNYGLDGKSHAVDAVDGMGACGFLKSTSGKTNSGYTSLDACQSNETQQCGWQYSCQA